MIKKNIVFSYAAFIKTKKTSAQIALFQKYSQLTHQLDSVLIDKCDAGDIIGLRPFFAKDNYLMTAKAREESIVYAIPIEVFRPFVSKNQEILNFLLESFD